MYIPPITFTYEYPEIQDQHMMKVVEKYQPKLDETYTYRVRSFGWRFKHFWLNVLLNTIVLPVVVIRYAVKVEGRENLRRNKKLLKDGFVTVSNHVIEWDFLTLLYAFFPRKAYFPIWSRNMETPMAPWFKTIGAIPVPTSMHAGRKFIAAMDSVLEEKKWLHFFAEGSMWYFYPAIRDFHIGEPLFPNHQLNRKDAEKELIKNARCSVMKMMGIKDEEENKKVMGMYKGSRHPFSYNKEL